MRPTLLKTSTILTIREKDIIKNRTAPANVRLDEDVLKTSFVFVFARRLDQDEYVRIRLTSSEEVLKTS